jgi:hypothetical protein
MKQLHILLFVFIAHFSQAQQNWELLPPHYKTPIEVKHVSHDGAIWAFQPAEKGILQSEDNAITWNTTLFNEEIQDSISTIGITSNKEDYVLCFINENVYQLFPGNIWQKILTFNQFVKDIHISSDKLYVALHDRFHSYYYPTLEPITNFKIHVDRIHFEEDQSGNLMVTTHDYTTRKVYLISPADGQWTDVSLPAATLHPVTYNMTLTSDGALHVLTNTAMFTRMQVNSAWEERTLPEDPKFGCILSNKTNRIYFATRNTLYQSDDHGLTWTQITNTPFDTEHNNISWNVEHPDKRIISNTNCGREAVYVNEFESEHWEIENINLDLPEKVLVYNTFSKGIVIKKCNSTIQLFDPEANQWIDISTDVSNFNELIILPSGKWLATDIENFYTSVDKGQNWIQLTNLPALSNVNIYITQNHDLFIGKQNGYYISTDEGLSWQEVDAPGFEFGVWTHMNFNEIFVYEEAIIYLGFSSLNKYSNSEQTTTDIIPNGTFLSVQNALGKQTSTGEILLPYYIMDEIQSDDYWLFLLVLNKTNFEYHRIKIHKSVKGVYPSPNGKLIGASQSELFISNDYGETWESILYNLPIATLEDLSTEPRIHSVNISSDNYVYVSLTNGSIYVNKEVLNSTSVNTTELNTANYVSVYPNPATEYADFMITSSEELSQLSLQIFDLNGKIIHAANGLTNGQSYRWQTKGQTSGVYFYQLLQSGSSLQSGKIIIR